MSLINFQKTMCYDALTQRAFGTNRGVATYFLNVRLTKTHTLVFKYTKMIGLSIVMLVAVGITSPKPSLSFGHGYHSRVVTIKRNRLERLNHL